MTIKAFRDGLAMLGAALLCGLAGSAWADEPAYPRGPLPDTVAPERYALTLTIDPRKPEFSGTAEIVVKTSSPTRSIWLHGQGLKVSAAVVRTADRTVAAKYTEVDTRIGVARVDVDTPIPAGQATLRFEYTAPFLTRAEGVYRVQQGSNWYAYTQMEPISARRAFPSFDDPQFKTPFTLTVLAADGDFVVANAPVDAVTETDTGLKSHRFEPSLPLPTYLVALAVGPFDVVDAPAIPAAGPDRAPIPLRGIAPRGQGARLGYALRSAAELTKRLEQYFDIAYPYPKLDLIASPAMPGAMENAGAIIFNSPTILLAEDAPLEQQMASTVVTAHEIAHHWFGDLVTPRWWNDIWLNESFAQWMSTKVVDDWRPELGAGVSLTSSALTAMRTDSQHAGRPIREPIDDSARIMSAFDSITYQKGGGVLAMIESYLGEDTFRRGVQRHLAAHAHGTATAEDFFDALAKAAGEPAVIDAFRSFVTQAGVPLVTVKRAARGRSLELSQSRYRPLGSAIADGTRWTVPFCATLYGATAPRRACTLISDRKTILKLPEGATGAAIMPNARGAGYYRFALEDAVLDALIPRAATLPSREALSLGDSIAAGFAAGTVSIERLLSGTRALARHPNRYAAGKSAGALLEVQNRLIEPAQRKAFQRKLAELYRPALEDLGLDPRAGAYASTNADQQLLRVLLARLVALEARDPRFREPLAKAARASLTEPSALDPGFRDIAWSVAAQERDVAVIEALMERIVESDDGLARRHAVAALAEVADPALAERIRNLLLDTRVREAEAVRLLAMQLSGPDTRDAAWEWIKRNLDALFGRFSPYVQGFTIESLGAFCDSAHRSEIERLLKPKVAALNTGELELARALESVDLCVAQKAAHRDELRAAFGGGSGT